MRHAIASLAIAAALGAATGPAAAQTEILLNSFAPPTHIINKGMVVPWIADVERATEGRVRIKMPGNSLAPPPRQMDIVTDGIVDGAYIFNAFLVKKAPLVQVSLLPGVTRSATGSAVALWRTQEKYFAKAKEFRDVVVLGFFATPPGEIYSLGAPIRKLGDFEDLKLWSLPGIAARAMGSLGAAVVPGPAVHMYQIISKGTVDAYAGVSVSSSYSFKVAQYAKSVTVLPDKIQGPTFSLFLAKNKWEGISAADRQAIREVSGEALARLSIAADKLEQQERRRFRKDGKTFIQASDALVAGIEKAWRPYQQAWAAQASKRGIDGSAALEFFKRVSREETPEIAR